MKSDSSLDLAVVVAKRGEVVEFKSLSCGFCSVELTYRGYRLILSSRCASLGGKTAYVAFFTEGDGYEEILEALREREDLKPLLFTIKL